MFKLNKLSEGRHYGLDVVRAIAITAVVIYHWPREQHQIIFRAISHFGYLGVDLFFVLSGYLIVGQSFALMQKDKFTVKRFYISRLMRTLPNYYFVLLVFMVLEGFDRYDYRYLFFFQNFGGLYQFTHSWSLCVEEHFYLFLPLLLAFLSGQKLMKKIPFIVGTILLVQIIIRFFIWKNARPDLIYSTNVDQSYESFFTNLFYPSYCRMDGLALGGLLAYIKYLEPDFWNKLLKKTHVLFFVSLTVFLPLAYFIYYKVGFFNSVLGFTMVAFCMSGIVISSISENSILQKIKLPGITLVSVLSYSIYLTHGYALHLSQKILQFHPLDSFGITINILRVILILILASLLYWGLEKPILKIRDKLLLKLT